MNEIKDVVKVRIIRSGSGYVSYYIRLPKKVVDELGIQPGDAFELQVVDRNTIVLKRLVPAR